MIDPQAQRRHFAGAAEAHFRWQTGDGHFGASERALLAAARLPAGRLLEIGCGEGGNLANLGRDGDIAGIDFVAAKAAHARARLPGGLFCAADAERLPFADGAFPAVLIRDVLHHARDRRAVLAEAARVLAPGGALAVIEPNRRSPMVLAQALLIPAERGVLGSTAARIAGELAAAGLDAVEVTPAQPLPLVRLLHPRLGLDAVGARPWAQRALTTADDLLGRVIPRWAWMYVVARGKKKAS